MLAARKRQGDEEERLRNIQAELEECTQAVENGKNFPSLEVLQKIIDVLNILPYQLFLEIPTENNENAKSKQTLMELKQEICSIIDNAISE